MKAGWWAAAAVAAVALGIAAGVATGWSAGAGTTQPAATPVPEESPTPAATAKAAGTAPGEPAEASPVRHRAMAIERLACDACHGPAAEWPSPEDHRAFAAEGCLDCHVRALEPPPIAIHLTPGGDEGEPMCAGCHSNIVQAEKPATATTKGEGNGLCFSCHKEDKAVGLPDDHAALSPVSCMVCHKTRSLVTPPITHETAGWEACSFCHSPGRLAPLKGAHKADEEEACVECHQEAKRSPKVASGMHLAALVVGGCGSCHGERGVAPLPASHSPRSEVLCTLCHGVHYQSVVEPEHSSVPGGLCARCHLRGDYQAVRRHGTLINGEGTP